MPEKYLGREGVANFLGVKKNSLNRYPLPEPDVMIDAYRGWSEETIERWAWNRPGFDQTKWAKRKRGQATP